MAVLRDNAGPINIGITTKGNIDSVGIQHWSKQWSGPPELSLVSTKEMRLRTRKSLKLSVYKLTSRVHNLKRQLFRSPFIAYGSTLSTNKHEFWVVQLLESK
jgi:hypothetical protein